MGGKFDPDAGHVHQITLCKYSVGICDGIAIAVSVANESDMPSRRLVSQHALPLARPTFAVHRMAIRECDRRSGYVEFEARGEDRQVRYPKCLERGAYEKPKAVADDFDRNGSLTRKFDERSERWVTGLNGREAR